jgi:hypothetical protein
MIQQGRLQMKLNCLLISAAQIISCKTRRNDDEKKQTDVSDSGSRNALVFDCLREIVRRFRQWGYFQVSGNDYGQQH